MKSTFTAGALALTLATSVSLPADAQYLPPGVDPNLAMALDQMISYIWQGCQMGVQVSCYNVQHMQIQAQQLIGAGQYCYQTNDPNACYYYQVGYAQAEQAYMTMMNGMGGQTRATPGYDPNNPLGATHADRMANIATWGANNSANWAAGQAQIDANHNSFMSYLRQ